MIVQLMLLGALVGQESERKKAVGRVVDSTGASVAASHVMLVHRPVGWCRQYGDVDVVQVDADGKGRFSAALLPGRSYSAFASWRENDQLVVTSIHEHVAAGAYLELGPAHKQAVGLRVRVDGQEPWSNVGPLQFRVCLHLANMHSVPLAPDANGTLVIPPMPGGRGTLEVLTRDGQVLWASWIMASVENSPAKLQVLTLPAPVEIPVQVVEASTGKPVPFARIRHRSGGLGYRPAFPVLDAADWSLNYWRPVGVADKDGLARVVVPAKASPWPKNKNTSVTLAACADGYAEAFAGWLGGGQYFDQKERAKNDKPLRILLHRQMPVRGRLTLDGKVPASGVPVILCESFDVTNLNRGGGWFLQGPTLVCRTDDNGGFSFPNTPLGANRVRLVVPLHDPVVRQNLSRDGVAPPAFVTPFADVGAVVLRLQVKSSRDFGETSLGLDRSLVVRLIDPDGKPVRGARVSLMPGYNFRGRLAVHATTDGSGRCLLLPKEREQVIVAVVRGVGYAVEPVSEKGEMEVRLRKFANRAGRVLWNDGTAVAGAEVYSRGTRRTIRRVGIAAPRWKIVNELNDSLCQARADAHGRFRIAYIPSTNVVMRLFASAEQGGEQRSTQFDFDVEARNSADPLVVELSR